MWAGGNGAASPPFFITAGETEEQARQTHPEVQEELVLGAGWMLQALQPHFGGCGRSLCQAQAGALLLSPGGTQLLRGLISTRHFIWMNPVSPRGQEYALYKVFINFIRGGTFPYTQKSLLICQCHLSSSWSQPDPLLTRGQSCADRRTHSSSQGSGTACATQAHPQGAEGQWVGSPAPHVWHGDPTYTPCSEPRGEAAQRHLPPSHSLVLLSHPRRVCSSQPRTGTVGDRRGEGCCHLQQRVMGTQSQPCHPAR